ncbi:MAG: ABC transporter permease [Thermogemmatispora sp.]|uniref:ABC transporter permease n=1 Tax=Thermogemmatispora sp. TaxID=1968838 RepID=UPI0019F09B5E|nr:FtsX-like permease family protein [Thermogemmatispora sp.]MBE3566000.1 ABC transporter permease [Thermogemmatispora sp.]
MTELFGIPLDTLSTILLIITLAIVALVLVLALRNRLFFKIGVRNIPRRRTQMMLIIFALMLSTTLLSSALATGDVMTGAVRSVATYNVGNVDETIEGGSGDLGFFDEAIYYRLRAQVRGDPDIAALGAAIMEQDLLVADQTSRQVRSGVTALAALPGSEDGFGGIVAEDGKGRLHLASLGHNEVYLNRTLAQLLNAHAGDRLYLYSQRWPGRRYEVRVRAIADSSGMIGDTPFIVSQVQLFRRIEQCGDAITQIFVANRGSDGPDSIAISDRVEEKLERLIPRNVHVIEVKKLAILNSEKAQDIFSRIFVLFALFIVAIGMLLIFLIFVLLAAERRVEMGMARAIGVLRRHLVLTFLFEGAIYDLLASFIGLAFGVAIGALLVLLLGPVLERFDFPLKLTFQPRSLLIAYCLGTIFTFCAVTVSAWLVSRMTVVEALRNLPEPERRSRTIAELRGLLGLVGKALRQRSRRLLSHLSELLIEGGRALVLAGLLPLLAGLWLFFYGLTERLVAPFSLGLSLLVIGGCLLLKTGAIALCPARYRPQIRRLGDRLVPAIAGLTICAYWAVPFDLFASLGLVRFRSSIEVFFLAGFVMTLGIVWALVANGELLVKPLLSLSRVRPRLHLLARLVASYPLHYRFRMGLSVTMFSLVVFALTVMTVITAAMQHSYADINLQTGGYDIQAIPYFRPLLSSQGKETPDEQLRAILARHGIDPGAFSAIGVRTTTLVGVIQPTAPQPAWRLYPAQVISGGFLQGYGLHLVARARGFSSDAAVWQALQEHPNYALIDSSALEASLGARGSPGVYDPSAPTASEAGVPLTPPGLDPYYTFALSGISLGETNFTPQSLWVTRSPGGDGLSALLNASVAKLTIIGVVDNSNGDHFGLYISQRLYGSIAPDPNNPEVQAYYFKVAPGQDKRALALRLGSAFLDEGLETTVLEDAIWEVRGPRILLSDIMIGIVGLALLLGVAALAITGTRAVVERRQQIGMLRALGCSRRLIRTAFLGESVLVAVLGSLIGLVLGLLLARNLFAANFLERYQTGLVFVIPWGQLVLIIGFALVASLMAALLPAWQAGRVTPIEALRYQ